MECTAASIATKATARSWLGFVVREPFFQCIALGILIWSGVEYWHDHKVREERYTIHVGPAERERIAGTYLQQFGQLPTQEQLEQLIDRYAHEEIYLREGLALELERNDEIVRRRVIQKYEFLQTDLAIPAPPARAVLKRWFEQNRARYVKPEQIAFSHIYLSIDKDGEQSARERAIKLLDRLRASRAYRGPDLGDAFPGPSHLNALAPGEVTRLFGQSQFSPELFKLPIGQWSGPYRSGYGWHLVRIVGHVPPVLPPFAEVEDRVLADYQDEQRRLVNDRNFASLRAKYTVTMTGGVVSQQQSGGFR